MCGRFNLRANPRQLAEIFQLLREPDLQPRYNIAPTQPVAVIRQVDTHRELSLIRWGLVPSWSKDPKSGPPLINARADTVATKPAFRAAFKRRRCLIPADGFYEWKKADGKNKQPFHIRMKPEHPFAFAGLWEHWGGQDSAAVDSCTIITTDANELLRPIHDRMPVILQTDDYDRWLNPKLEDVPTLEAMLQPFPAEEMTAYPISTLVNSPRNDSVACIEVARESL
jgi:putative SOS response-associated peptidase YedK